MKKMQTMPFDKDAFNHADDQKTGKMGNAKKRLKAKKKASENDLPLLIETQRLSVSGFNQPRLLAALQRENVRLRNLNKQSPHEMIFDIGKKDSKKTFAILEKLCYNYTVVNSSGLTHVLKNMLARIGLVLGLAVFTAALVFSYGFIWRVELTGYDKVPEQVILSTLKEHNVSGGKSLKGVSVSAVKNALNRLDGILESTVQIVGTTVKVTVIESTDFVKPDDGAITDITAKYDAEITRIVNKQGTTLVSRGQRVFKGTPLIGAYRLDEEGNVDEPVKARGEVYGKVAFTTSLTFSTTEYISRPTGKTYKSTVLQLFGLKIGKSKNPFKNFLKKTETVNAFQGTMLPIKVIREQVEEVEYTAVEVNVDERAEQLVRETVLEKVIACGGSEIATTFSLTKMTDNLYSLNVFTQAEMLIS